MSCKVPISDLNDDMRQLINSKLIVVTVDKFSNQKSQVCAYTVTDDDHVCIPFSFAHNDLKIPHIAKRHFPKMTAPFTGSLRESQISVKNESIKLLNETGCVLINCKCGFGKTVTSISMCASIQLKTLVVVNKLVLMKQWEESIRQFSPSAKIQRVESKTVIDESNDYFVVNAINIAKRPAGTFKFIGCLVMDELHLLMAEKLSKLTTFVFPRYLIGLSATPFRLDGMNSLINFYFGSERVMRTFKQMHTVFHVETGFTPKTEANCLGKLNWSSVIQSQSADEDRNNLIVRIINHFKDRVFLVMVKRVEHGKVLAEKLVSSGENVTTLFGTSNTFDKSARVLVGTTQKVGVGFDFPKLDTLLLATDVENYYIQYMSRVFRTRDTHPIIFDLVDDNHVLRKHFKSRESVYIEQGGCIEKFSFEIL
jgi:superfamily II DNA or RNA helicase